MQPTLSSALIEWLQCAYGEASLGRNLVQLPINMAAPAGAALIAKALQELGVKVIFGLVGIPVVQIAEEAITLGIRFIAFRNEQAASYAASAYGYLTGRPGVCLVVGGPGVSNFQIHIS